MASSVKVTWEQRLGRVGAKAIESRLSYFSKTSKEEFDVGIDFRCELVENDHPSIPFFVQAKGTEHFDNAWSKGIKKSTVLYWLRQQSPVYIIVYDEKTGNCYWMSIEGQRYNLFQKLGEKDRNTISIKIDRTHILERGRDKNTELIKKIKDDLNLVQLFFGFPQAVGNGYVKTIPHPPRSTWEFERLKEQIRLNLYSLTQHYSRKSDNENLLLCLRFLGGFDKSHYNHFVWLGLLNRSIGNYQEAKDNFSEALKICKRDPNWPRGSMKLIISYIKKEIRETNKMLAGV